MALTAAATFTWLGMVLAISFLEAPLKFRAPGVTVPLGLGIGRLVFRGLNGVEVVLAAVIVVTLVLVRPGPVALVGAVVAVACLLVHLVAVRPALSRRTERVLAGDDTGRGGHAHLAYIGLEVVKVSALLVLGVAAS
jgi:hypothetical protein